LSKIFDALRKAELERSGKTARKPKGGRPHKPDNEGEKSFMQGINEDFRRSLLNLRNSIDSETKDLGSRVIMFTSAIAGEGKSMVASFLARILAIGEADRILLVDCAVVNPTIHRLFGLENKKGILDFLAGEAAFEDIVVNVDENVLDVITTGQQRNVDISQPLFNSEAMGIFINRVGEMYDYVLIDTSAVLESPETPIIGSYANGTVIIVQAGRTKREVIKRAMMMVEKLNGKFIGTVLNRKKYYIPEFIYRRV
jgi:capsular exopolysaccharide synthesis family protein